MVVGAQDGTESEGEGDGGCWQARCEGVNDGAVVVGVQDGTESEGEGDGGCW